MRVKGAPVRLPDSRNAIHVVADELPGTKYKLVVFSRTALHQRGALGPKVLFEVDRSAWTLDILLVDEAGHVAKRAAVRHQGEAVSPFDLDVTLGDRKAAILVQWDRRGYLDSRAPGDESTSPTRMQVLELELAGEDLRVAEGPLETLTRSDIRTLVADYIHEPQCSELERACGPIVTEQGVRNCGTCAAGEVCENNQCRDASKGECVPIPRSVLCPERACGQRYDGCSGVVDCGGCAPGLECGGGEEAGMCADPFAVSTSDVRGMFGASVCGCFADDRGNTIAVDCPTGQRCENAQCVGVAVPDPNAPDLLSPDAAAGP